MLPKKCTSAMTLSSIVVFTMATVAIAIHIPGLPTASYRQQGDFTLGAILPVHKFCLEQFCSKGVRNLGMLQRIEAVSFAVREINQRQDLLPNHTLGFIMYDDCYKDITGLGQALHFIEQEGNTCSWSQMSPLEEEKCLQDELEMQSVAAILGSEGSTPTTQLANLFSSLRIPQVSYISTTPLLDNRHRYGNFFRMVPSDVYQIKVMVSLLKKFDWRYVNVLYAEGYYGENAFKAFVAEIDQLSNFPITNDYAKGICVASVHEIKQSATMHDYKSMMYQLLNGHTKASVVILFVPVHVGLKIMEAAKLMFSKGIITWIVSDAFARAVEELHGFTGEMEGSLSINFDVPSVPRFEEYFSTLGPSSDTGNPWLQEFARDHFGCDRARYSPELVNCSDPNLKFVDNAFYFPEPHISLVIDAVYTIAHGLHNALQTESCRQSQDKPWHIQCAEQHLCSNLSQLEFEGETGWVQINDKGSVVQSYVVNNIQKINDSYQFVPVAFWRLDSGDSMDGELVFNGNPIQWAKDSQPQSICSQPCGIGQTPALEQVSCCWVCNNCSADSIVNSRTRCEQCTEGTWPNQTTRSQCVAIIPAHLRFTHELGLALSISSIIGALVCFSAGIIYIKHSSHPAIKASSRELAAILLSGLILAYLFTFLYIAKPSKMICYFRGLGWGLCFTLMYAPIVTRTIRILRIFRAGQALRRNPSCVNSKSQVVIASSIIVLHALLLVGLASAYVPHPVVVTTSPGQQVITCSFLNHTFLASSVYNGVLLLVALVLAFQTRRVPDMYNESRYISFCVYCTVIIQLAFIPAYYTVENPFDKIMFLGLAIILTATVVFLFIFAPKVFAIYCVNKAEPQMFTKGMRHVRRTRRVANDGSSLTASPDQSAEQTRTHKTSKSIVNIYSVSSPQLNPPDLTLHRGSNQVPNGLSTVTRTSQNARLNGVTSMRRRSRESNDSDP